MTSVELDMIQTTGIGALALIVGMVLTRKVSFLQKFCVPSPVSGGIIFSLISLILYSWFDIELSFDGTLKDVFITKARWQTIDNYAYPVGGYYFFAELNANRNYPAHGR